MPWNLVDRRKSAKTWYDGAKNFTHATICPVHYQDGVGSGDFINDIDTSPFFQSGEWHIQSSDWHYKLRPSDGRIGFGGRQGQHFAYFTLERAGYLHVPTRSLEQVGGLPDFDAGNLSSQVYQKVLGPAGAQVAHNVETIATWSNIFNGVDMPIRLDGRKLRFDLQMSQATRLALPNPSTPPSQTWFGFRFLLDVSDIPRWLRGGILQDVNGDFNDSDLSKIRIENAAQQVLAYLPTSYAYHATERHPNQAKVRLHKRIYFDGSNHWLYVGAPVLELNALPSGGILFDPTFDIAADNEDGSSYATNEEIASPAFWLGVEDDGGPQDLEGGWIYRSTGIPQGATIDTSSMLIRYYSGGGGTSGLPLDGDIYGYDVDSPDDFDNAHVHRVSDHHGRTTALVAANIGSAADYTTSSLNAILQEIVDRGGFGGDIGLTWRSASPSGTHYFSTYEYTVSAANAAELTVTWTGSDPEGPLVGGKLVNGGILKGRLIR